MEVLLLDTSSDGCEGLCYGNPGGEMEGYDFRAFVSSHRWVFAKTMPDNPHEYTLRRESSDAVFDAAVRFIREEGETEVYEGRPYTVFRCDDHKYWTMGAPVEETILINRKLLPHAGGPPV